MSIWGVTEGEPITAGGVVAAACRFERCQFFNIGFAVSRDRVDHLRASLGPPL